MAEEAKGNGRRGARAPRIAGVALLLIGVTAVVGGYVWYALRRIEWFSGRDLRALSTLAAQIESEIESHAQTVIDVAAAADPGDDLLVEPRPAAYRDFLILHTEASDRTAIVREELTFTLVPTAPRPHLEIRALTRGSDTPARGAIGAVPVEKYVHPLFEQTFLGIFDVLLLITADGKVLEQAPTTSKPPLPPLFHDRPHDGASGRLTDGVVVKDLGALERRDGFRSWSQLNPRELRGASRRTEVRINGAEYYLFTQPVRFQLERGSVAAGDKTAVQDSGGSDLLVGALVRKPKLRREAMAISDSLVLIGLACIILLLSWYPFVRIMALPKGAPLHAVDVVLAAVGAVVAAAVMTVIIIDFATYRRMRAIEDESLAKYASKLREDLLRDILRTAVAAEALRDTTANLTKSPAALPIDWTRNELFQQPYFESVLWAEKGGKATTIPLAGEKAPPMTSVVQRRFFDDVTNDRWWSIGEEKRAEPHRVIIEVVAPRDDLRTIVAVPATNGRIFAAYVRFIHFIDPVVPPGFRFAVIDDQGVVQFHSDKHRALHENLFKETEDDRQLRAAVFARRDAQINARYWGGDHQLYVAPVPGTTWAVIAMRDETMLRSVNSEVIALTALLLALYSVVFAAGFVLLRAIRPRYRAPWLWPNAKGFAKYKLTILALFIEVITFAACVLLLDSWAVLYIAFLAPVRGLSTAFLLGNPTDDKKPRWAGSVISGVVTGLWILVWARASFAPIVDQSVCIIGVLLVFILIPLLAIFAHRVKGPDKSERDPFLLYKVSGLLMIIGIGVLPAFAFLQLAMRLGTEARIKYSQLVVADFLETRLNLLEHINARERRIAFDCYELPHIFESYWTLDPRATKPRPRTASEPDTNATIARRFQYRYVKAAVQPAWLPEEISMLLPHYAESSVALRNLQYNTASDAAWHWCRDPDMLIFRKRVELQSQTSTRLYGKPGIASELIVQTPLPIVTAQQRLFARSERLTSKQLGMRDGCKTPPDSDVGKPIALAGVPAVPPQPPRLPVFFFVQVLIWLAIGFLFFYLLFSAVGFMGRHVFLYGVKPPNWPLSGSMAVSAGTNLFVVNPAPDIKDASGVLDLTPAIANSKSWSDLRARADAGSPLVDLLIRDFSKVFLSSARDNLLTFLEEVVAAKRHAIIVFSDISAATLLGAVPVRTRARWAGVFAQFVHVDQTLDVPDEPGDENRYVFERIWADSSGEERLLLYQIARDGLVNEKNIATLRRLMGRGLIKHSQELQFVPKGLERFVLNTGNQESVAAAEREAESPRWTSLPIALTVFVIAGLVVVLTSQKDVINYTTGILTTIAAAVPALLQLIAIFGGRASSENT